MDGWLITVDREMSGGLVSIQDLYAARFSDPEIAIEAVHAILAYGSRIQPAVIGELSDAILLGLKVLPNSAVRLIGE